MTAELNDALLRKTASGTMWIIGWRVVTRALGLISTLVLVRYLLPADFGLVALAVGFSQGIEGLSWLDVEDAVVREKAPDRTVYDTGFTLNVLRGLGTACIIFALAWPAGRFFSEPRIVPVLLALAAVTAMDGFLNIGIVEYRRDFAFHREFRLWIIPRLAGTIAAMTIAVVFASYWALVAGILIQRGLRVVASYWMHPYRPRFSLQAWHVLGKYSLWTWALGLLTLLRDRSDSLVIGRLLGPASVGIFSISTEIAALPTTELVEPMCRAAFSGFATGRNEELTPAETFRRMIATTALVTLPAGIGISLIAAPLVRLAFGELWTEAVLPIQILALAGTITVFGYVSATLFRTHGLMGNASGIMLGALVLRIGLLVLLTLRYGLIGATIAVACAIVVEQGCYVVQACRRFAISAISLFAAVWRVLLATLVMASILVLTGLGWQMPEPGAALAMLVQAIGLGVVGYGGTLLLAWVAAGRPGGAEADIMGLLRWLAGRALRGT